MYAEKLHQFGDCNLIQYRQMDPSLSVEDLDGLLPEKIETCISSSESLSENVKKLRGIIEIIPVTEDAWNVLEGAIQTLGDVSFNVFRASFDSHSRRPIR